ncbi:MAG: TfoX/Sxy family DNA transformation protein [Gammaproteobacteria bacterium]|nr:TfoX/Sxy family DNA transformation protein [Gammaproteobacteria bacterium]
MCGLRNIGKTVSTRLHGIGITNEAELKRLGAEKAKLRISAGLAK